MEENSSKGRLDNEPLADVQPRFLFVLLANYQVFLSSVILYALWDWVFSLPASWIPWILVFRATYLSVLHFPKMRLRLDETTLIGPKGATYTQAVIGLEGALKGQRLGLTFWRNKKGEEIFYRRGWYQKKEIDHFERLVIQQTKVISSRRGNTSLFND